MVATANEELLDRLIGHEIGLRRYSNATLRKIIGILNRIDKRLVDRIAASPAQNWTAKRQEKLLDQIRAIMAEAYAAATGELRSDIGELAAYEAGFQARGLVAVIPVQWDVVTPSAAQLYAAVNARPFQGRFLKDYFKDLPETAFKRVRDEIRMGFVEGRTTDQIVRAIRGTKAQKYKDGVLEVNRRSAEMLVRTVLNHTANVARNHTYKQNPGLIKGVQWVSTLDGRTSAVCRSRDGTVYPIDEGPRPPAHPNCRSTTIPVLKSWKELGINLKEAPEGTRASMNGQVAARMTYNDWLKKQPVAFQNEVLGVKKAKLYREGKLPLDRFVDRSGREYTLDELKRREADAWETAGLE